MKWFNNLKIRAKLLIVFGILLCITIFFSIFAVVQTRNLDTDLTEILVSYQARQLYIVDALDNVYKIRLSNFAMLQQYRSEGVDFSGITNAYISARDGFRSNLEGYKELVYSDIWFDADTKNDRIIRADYILSLFEEYVDITKDMYDDSVAYDEARRQRVLAESRPLGDALTAALMNKAEDERGLYNLIVETTQVQSRRVLDDVAQTTVIFAWISCVLILISIFMLFFTISSINKPILRLKNAVYEIAKGNLEQPLQSDRKDEIGELSNSISHMVEELARSNEIQKALEAEKAASAFKSSFLANMSHEIRTPMNVILGIAEIEMRDETLKPHTRDAISRIYSSGDLLLNIINDILDLSKIEAGKLELSNLKYEVASLINDTITLNMIRIGEKPIEFMLSVDENLPNTLMGDEIRIKQVLNNLLSNAFKYTEEGVVKLSISHKDNEEDDNIVDIVFCVSDTGQGMTAEQVAKLGEEYSRFNVEANRTTQGTGLGMSITKNLINLMNGSISIKSEVELGSSFVVQFPQGKTDGKILGKEIAGNLENFKVDAVKEIRKAQIVYEPMPYGKVLLVDDMESNNYVTKGLLAPYELQIETAISGYEAISRIQDGNVYDIIFMDHMMPKMDGIVAAEKIHELGYKEPIVALTANAVVGQADIFLDSGFDDFIAKPIDLRQLNSVIKKYVRDKQPREVIETARKMNKKHKQIEQELPISHEICFDLLELFTRDAIKTIAALEKLFKKDGDYSDEDFINYTAYVHGLKRILANIEEQELSDAALVLEEAGRNKDTKIISEKTTVFLDALRAFIASIPYLTTADVEKDQSKAHSVSPELLELYIRDINKAIVVLEEFIGKNGVYDEEELRTCVISVHATKSILAGLGELELSHDAANLEQIGRENDTDKISLETPKFLDALKGVYNKYLPLIETDEGVDPADENLSYLEEKMLDIKKACEAYDQVTAKAIVAEIKEKEWSSDTKELLATITEKLLCGDYEEVIEITDKMT